jgi:hypothetical protein
VSGFAVVSSSPLNEDPQETAGVDQPVPFFSAVERGYTAQTQVLNTMAREEETRTEFWARHRAAEAKAGRKLTPSRFMLNEDRQEDYLADRLGGTQAGPLVSAGMDDKAYAAELAKLGVEGDDALHARVDARLKALVGRSSEAAQSGASGAVGNFIGQAAGAMTDIPNVVGLLYGGVGGGRTLATRMLTQGAINAGIEAVTAPGRLEDAKRYGGPEFTPAQAATDVVAAGVGGAVLQGAGEAAGALVRPLIRRSGGQSAEHVAPAIRRAAQVAEQAQRDDLAIGAQAGEDHAQALTALDRGEVPQLQPDRPLGEATDYRGRPMVSTSFDPRQVAADPVRFQYKSDGDAEGVTQRLRGVEAWDATASGKVLVWEDRAGRQFIADGHQRRALALRMEDKGWDARLDGYLMREADGWSAQDVRVVAALKNIREGSGSPLDAAKVLREAPEAIHDRSLPVSGEYMSQARGLSLLSEPAFRAVVNKVIPERYAADIGLMAGQRPDLHEAMVKLLHEAEPANADEARALVVEALQDDWIKGEGDQVDLFGYDPSVSAMIARAKIAANVKRSLARDARLFSQLVRNADAIEAGGNALARDANEARLAIDRTALEVTSKLALRSGPVGDAMRAAVGKVHAGETPAAAAKDVLKRVREAIEAGERLDDQRGVELDPKPPGPQAEALLEGVDEPAFREAQTKEAPEDADLEASPGLFDDLAVDDRHLKARDLLAACIPAE